MKIKDIQIDGFGVWSELSVHSMPDTMTVFYGPNEAGKTTLMHFLRTMFYGFTEHRRMRYLPPVYGGKPGGGGLMAKLEALQKEQERLQQERMRRGGFCFRFW